MHFRFIPYALLAAISLAASVLAQPYPPAGYQQPAGGNYQPPPDQQMQPQLPQIVRRSVQPGMQQPLRPQQPAWPPFVLTPQEQAQVEQVLLAWEQRNNKVKTFDCQFKRWVYNSVFGRSDQPMFVDLGVIKYAAPDRGMFRVDARAEHWISDGKSIIEYDHVTKRVIEHKLPPEQQGKAIADGPLPFLFNSTAQSLKDRYLLRIVTPRELQAQQIWLEAYPLRLEDRKNFHHAQFIINIQGMTPNALKLFHMNGKDYSVYSFFGIVLNDPLRMFSGNPFRAVTPLGWKLVVEPAQDTQARRVPNDGRR